MKSVSVLGTLHNYHQTKFRKIFSLKDLKRILRVIEPEYVVAELVPDWKQRYGDHENLPDFKMEYREAIIPLSKELGYEVIPVDVGSLLYAEKITEWETDRRSLLSIER